MVKTQFEQKIKVVRSDTETEYINAILKKLFKEKRILCETSCVGIPQ
jgi:hypothetical protein